MKNTTPCNCCGAPLDFEKNKCGFCTAPINVHPSDERLVEVSNDGTRTDICHSDFYHFAQTLAEVGRITGLSLK